VTGSISGTGAITTSGNISTSGTGTISTASGGSIKTNTFDSTAMGSSMTIGNLMTSATTLTLGTNCLIKMKSPAITNTGSTPSTQAASNMNIFGGLMYSSVIANYTIPSTGINCDFYISAGGSGGYTVYLPTVSAHQIIHIRHFSATNVNITTAVSTTKIYPIQGSIYSPTFNMSGNQVQNFYCDGTDWYGF